MSNYSFKGTYSVTDALLQLWKEQSSLEFLWHTLDFGKIRSSLVVPKPGTLRGPQGFNLTYQYCCRRQAQRKAGSLRQKTERAQSRQSLMNRSRSSSRALGRSHCKHLQERREGGEEGGRERGMTPSHVASLRRVLDVFLRGEERVLRNGNPDSPLRSGSMFYPCNNLKMTEKQIKRKKQARKTKEKSPNSTRKLILSVSLWPTSSCRTERKNESLVNPASERRAFIMDWPDSGLWLIYSMLKEDGDGYCVFMKYGNALLCIVCVSVIMLKNIQSCFWPTTWILFNYLMSSAASLASAITNQCIKCCVTCFPAKHVKQEHYVKWIFVHI